MAIVLVVDDDPAMRDARCAMRDARCAMRSAKRSPISGMNRGSQTITAVYPATNRALLTALAGEADEILVERARAFRANAGPNEQALVDDFNQEAMERFGPIRGLTSGRAGIAATDSRLVTT